MFFQKLPGYSYAVAKWKILETKQFLSFKKFIVQHAIVTIIISNCLCLLYKVISW